MLNYLGMMGWTMPTGAEMFTLQEMTDAFDIKRVSLGGPIFDTEKLDWLNGKYIRETLDDKQFAELFAQWAFNPEKIQRIVPLLKQRVERFSDVAELGSFFISANPVLSVDLFEHKSLTTEVQVKILQFSLWHLEVLQDWNRESIEASLQGIAVQLDLKIRDFLFPLFLAISGKAVSTSVIESIDILKLDITRARLRAATDTLGGVSKKVAKNLEREYRSLD
jgi:glutamyl-tRNA synthetase